MARRQADSAATHDLLRTAATVVAVLVIIFGVNTKANSLDDKLESLDDKADTIQTSINDQFAGLTQLAIAINEVAAQAGIDIRVTVPGGGDGGGSIFTPSQPQEPPAGNQGGNDKPPKPKDPKPPKPPPDGDDCVLGVLCPDGVGIGTTQESRSMDSERSR